MTLRQFFDGLDEKPYKWAKRKGIAKSIVYNLLAGKRVRWESAKRISEATGGAVTMQESWDEGRLRRELLLPITTTRR